LDLADEIVKSPPGDPRRIFVNRLDEPFPIAVRMSTCFSCSTELRSTVFVIVTAGAAAGVGVGSPVGSGVGSFAGVGVCAETVPRKMIEGTKSSETAKITAASGSLIDMRHLVDSG